MKLSMKTMDPTWCMKPAIHFSNDNTSFLVYGDGHRWCTTCTRQFTISMISSWRISLVISFPSVMATGPYLQLAKQAGRIMCWWWDASFCLISPQSIQKLYALQHWGFCVTTTRLYISFLVREPLKALLQHSQLWLMTTNLRNICITLQPFRKMMCPRKPKNSNCFYVVSLMFPLMAIKK